MENEPMNSSRRTVTCKAVTLDRSKGPTKMGLVPLSTAEFFTDIRKPFIRSTPLDVLDECPRKFLYEYRLGIKARRYEAALTMGDIVHQMQKTLMLGGSEEDALETAKLVLSKEQQRLTGAVQDTGFLPGGADLVKVLRTLEEDYNKARAVGLLFHRFMLDGNRFDPSKWEILEAPDGTKMVEVILELQHPDFSRPFRCPCDLVLRKKGTNKVWIVDYKTTSKSPKVRARTTRFSGQIALYRLVLQAHLDEWGRGEKVEGSFHAIIQKPGIKLCGTDQKNATEWNCSPIEAYLRRLAQWYKKKEDEDPDHPPMVLDPNEFHRPPMTRELYGRLRQFCKAANAAPDVDHFYRVEGACTKWNSVCPYLRICNSDPVMWPSLIEESYELGFREDKEDG